MLQRSARFPEISQKERLFFFFKSQTIVVEFNDLNAVKGNIWKVKGNCKLDEALSPSNLSTIIREKLLSNDRFAAPPTPRPAHTHHRHDNGQVLRGIQIKRDESRTMQSIGCGGDRTSVPGTTWKIATNWFFQSFCFFPITIE
jgi:hypothetical protein